MFFVGASTHIFIYLLIPVFFVVCCYFKDTVGSLGDFLSVNVVSEQKAVEYSKDTYVYKKEVKKKKSQQRTFALERENINSSLTSYHYIFYPSPTIVSVGLRAPPSLSI